MSNLINTISKDSVNRTSFSNGLMPIAAAEKFIAMIFDSTPLFQRARTIVMKAEKQTLAGILEQKGQTRIVGANNTGNTGAKDSEDQSLYRRSMSAYKFDLETKEYSLSRTLSNKVLSDNIEGQNLGSIIANNLKEMVRVDLEDSAINSKFVDPNQSISATLTNAPGLVGTTLEVGATQPVGFPTEGSDGHGYLKIVKGGSTELCSYGSLENVSGTWTFKNVVRAVTDEDAIINSVAVNLAIGDTITWYRHHLRGLINGWLELIANPPVLSSQLVDGSSINSGSISFGHLNTMLKALPRKYVNPNITYIMSLEQLHKYREWLLTNHSVAFAGTVISDSTFAPTLGYNVITPVDFPSDKILLTDPKNLVIGIWENIVMRKITADTDTRLADTDETYWNLRMRAGFTVERPDACVLLNGLV